MDFSSFVKYNEKDVIPETPHLSISLRAPIELSIIGAVPYPIHFTIRRVAKGDGTDSRPCIFRFDPSVDAFSPPSGLILLRHRWSSGGGGLEAVPVNHGYCHSAGQQDSSQFLWELAAPGDEVSLTATLPERYFRALEDSWHTFTLLYPGTEFLLWDWGTAQERVGWVSKGTRKLVVPGGARVNFAAGHFSEYRTADPPWFNPPPLVEPSDRV
ncbi:hypothetical protein N657DRAFT_490390 [Parathielavia appendiculata]|uniref:Uncharacterized protein n=1 Tax=Parathielavia appendiculata TaxID=2587402 RepID=A0AAN6YY73_9PEZI|nr:hypothetical protein N657DRAFT_490390 [Parathielavia appendiculata]